MAVNFLDIIQDLEGTGFYEVVLPFLLVFAVIFAVLENVKIFGNNSTKINAIIGIVAGFLMIRNDILVEFMNDIISRFSVILIIVLAFLIVFGIFGAKTSGWGKGFFAFFILVALVAGIFVLSERMGYYDITGEIDISDLSDFYEDYGGTVWIIIVVLIIALIVGGAKKNEGDKRSYFERLGEGLGQPGNRGD